MVLQDSRPPSSLAPHLILSGTGKPQQPALRTEFSHLHPGRHYRLSSALTREICGAQRQKEQGMAGGSMYFFPGWRILGIMVGAWVAAQDVHRGEPYGLQRLTIPFAPCAFLLLPRASCSFSVGKMASGELSCLWYRGPVGSGQSRLGEACWTTLPLLLPIHNRPTLGRRAVSKGAVWTAEREASP